MEHDTTETRRAEIHQQGELAGRLEESDDGWVFRYEERYGGQPISLTMPVRADPYRFDTFPAVLEGLLPEGAQLDALLRRHKIDRDDLFRQLVTVGRDLVGSLTAVDASGAGPR